MRPIKTVKITEAMAVDTLAKSLPGRVYNLAAGDPDLPLCGALTEAFSGTDLSATHRYGASSGQIALREKLWRDPSEVMIGNGAKQLIYMALAVVTHPGDRVLIIGPCWVSYLRICEILGLSYELLIGEKEDRYLPTVGQLARAITEDTAAVLFNHPNNPTGVVYPDEFLSALLSRISETDSFLISDEVYRYLSEKPFRSLRGNHNVITVDGFSKAANLTGWRLGYAIAEKPLCDAMIALQSQMSGPPSTLIQDIVSRAYDRISFSSFEDYRARIDLLCEIPKFAAARPMGGFYFYVPIDDQWESSKALCEEMLLKHRIAITPGDDYGVERTVRISVASEGTDALSEILPFLREI